MLSDLTIGGRTEGKGSLRRTLWFFGNQGDRIVPKVKKGSIILCHNNSDHIVEALPIVLMGLKNKGISLVRMDELVFTENYTVDNQGIQHLK